MAIELSHLYQRLPTELQLKIWEDTLEPRCIKICGEDLVDRLPKHHNDGAPPLALQVCQMLRAHFLPRYPKLFQGEHVSTPIVRPHVRINSALDTVVIYSLWPSTIMSLSRWSGSHDLSRIRHLAVPSLLWQSAILSYSYPDWRKAMSNFTHLETFTIVTDQIMPKHVAVDLLEEAIKKCLLSVKAENAGWTIPQAKIIHIDDVFSRECDSYDRLDLVDFLRGDIKEECLRGIITRPKCRCPFCDGPWILRLFSKGFLTPHQILKKESSSTPRAYTPRPSVFSLWPNIIESQAQGTSNWILDDSILVAPCAMAILSFASFVISSLLFE